MTNNLFFSIVDSEAVTVQYPDVASMLLDLRLMGASNALSLRSGGFPVKLLSQLEKHYREHYCKNPGDNLPLTFCIIYFMAWTGKK